MLKKYIISGWPSSRQVVKPWVEKYWPIRYELVMIDSIVMKGFAETNPRTVAQQPHGH